MYSPDYNAHTQLRATAAARFADAQHVARVCASDARASELRAAYAARRTPPQSRHLLTPAHLVALACIVVAMFAPAIAGAL